jgi:hypothetical protein
LKLLETSRKLRAGLVKFGEIEVEGTLARYYCAWVYRRRGEWERSLADSPWSDLVQESLTIGGWVAMWRPMEIFLYEWWPIQRMGRLYQKMSRMHVEVKKRAV